MGEPPRLSREQVREVDRRAIEELGIPGIVLMENAGRGAAEQVLELLARHGTAPRGARVVIACGGGNNGGDGYVVARHLALAGCAIELFSTHARDALRGDAALARSIVERMGLRVLAVDAHEPQWGGAAVLIDALLGTGAVGEPRGKLALAIERFNAVPDALRVALDLPSGLDCDTGEAPGACVRADLTVTFVAEKLGFANPRAARFLGRVVVVGIGAPIGA